MSAERSDHVSVVIPTMGRATLRAAVRSALAQTGVECEVVLVVDAPSDDQLASRMDDVVSDAHHFISPGSRSTVQWIASGGKRGGGRCRQIGTELCTKEWVSYLDDDDQWHPTKIRRQLDALRLSGAESTLVSCRLRSRPSNESQWSRPVPRHVYDGRTNLPEWLFHNRRLGVDRNTIQTSTFLLQTSVALKIGWREIPRHQDWDFLLRASELFGVLIVQLDDVLVDCVAGSPSSISAKGAWKPSYAWIAEMSPNVPSRAMTDFLLGQCARYALQSNDLVSFLHLVREAYATARPSVRANLLALSGLLSRSRFDRLSHRGRADSAGKRVGDALSPDGRPTSQ